MKRPAATGEGAPASELITRRIAEYSDWRGPMLARLRALIKQAVPQVVEEWKWGTPVWSHQGIVCTGEVYKTHVKMTFAKGAFVSDPAKLFNSSLEGNLRRAIDFKEGEKLDAPALKALIRAAAELNVSGLQKPAATKNKLAAAKNKLAAAKNKLAAAKTKTAAAKTKTAATQKKPAAPKKKPAPKKKRAVKS
jgi:hypothetical protein